MVEQQTNIPAISSRERFSYGISKSLHSQLQQSLPQCLGKVALCNWAWGLEQGIKLDLKGTQCWGKLQEQGERLRMMNWKSRQVSTIDVISKCNYHQHINPSPLTLSFVLPRQQGLPPPLLPPPFQPPSAPPLLSLPLVDFKHLLSDRCLGWRKAKTDQKGEEDLGFAVIFLL